MEPNLEIPPPPPGFTEDVTIPPPPPGFTEDVTGQDLAAVRPVAPTNAGRAALDKIASEVRAGGIGKTADVLINAINYPFRKAGEAVGALVQKGAEFLPGANQRSPQIRPENLQPTVLGMLPKLGVKASEMEQPINETTKYGPTAPEVFGEMANQATQLALPGRAIRGAAAIPARIGKALSSATAARTAETNRLFNLNKARATQIDTLAQTEKTAQEVTAGDSASALARLQGEEAATTNAAAQIATERAARLQKIRDARVNQLVEENAGKTAAQKTATDLFPSAPSLREAGTAYKGELTPEGFQPGIYQRERAATSKYFTGKYEPLKEAGGNTAHAVENLSAAQDQILSEVGIAKDALATPAERVAENLKGATQEQVGSGFRSQRGGGVSLDEDVYAKLKPMLVEQRKAEVEFLSGQRSKAPAVPVDVYKTALGQTTAEQTIGEMISNRQRLRAAVRAAEDTKNDNLARQFREMENGLTTDIETAATDNPALLSDLRKTDLEYALSRMQYGKKALPRKAADAAAEDVVGKLIRPASAPASEETITQAWKVIKKPEERDRILGAWFKDGIESAVDKKTGVWDRSKLASWWNNYSEETKAAAFAHDPAKKAGIDELVSRIENTSQIDPASILKSSATRTRREVGAIERQKNQSLKAVADQVSAQIAAAEKQTARLVGNPAEGKVGSITKEAELTKKLLQNRVLGQVKDLQPAAGQSYLARKAKWAGYGMMIYGGARGNLYEVAIGGVLVMTPELAAKMMNSKKGLGLMLEGMQVSPGTKEGAVWAARAAAAARQLGGQAESTIGD